MTENQTRASSLTRTTNETDISLSFSIEGMGKADLQKDVPFFNHMLDLFTKHGPV